MRGDRTTFEPGLEATVYTHDLAVGEAKFPVWTLATRGLAASGQREVVFTIVRNAASGREFPKGVLGYIPVLKHFASQGRIVGEGGVSGYRAPGPFGLGPFVGVAFMDAEAIPEIPLPDAAMAGVFLTESELAMASACSTRRVLNRLGRAARYFPAPYWSDASRGSVYALDDSRVSLLAKFEHATVADAFATLRGDVMDLSIPQTFATTLASRTASRLVSAILPARERGVTAALVWSPGQTEPEAIFADGPRPTAFAATFVAFVPNDAEQDDIRFMEDGYVVLLSQGSADQLVAKLRAGTPLELRGGSEKRTLRIAVTRTN
jgi:hypothetical protein